MNINQLKAFLSEKPQHLGSKDSIQNQLRDSGLQQAMDTQSNFVSLRADKFSSSASFGARIFSNSLNNSLEINQQKPNFSEKKSKESSDSLFDFNEVAKNVLNFIGGAVKNAKNNGADETVLNDLFEQASYGVLKGIKLAEKDLAGFMSEDIEKGISESKNLIQQGIEKLKQDIFNPSTGDSQQANSIENTQASYAKLETGQLNIRTRDGDQVTIRFEDLQSFELNQQEIRQLATQPEPAEELAPESPEVTAKQQTPAKEKAAVAQDTAETSKDDAPQTQAKKIDEQVAVGSVVDSETKSQEGDEITQSAAEIANPNSQNAIFYQEQSLSFSVRGELDDGELKAIGNLVADANELADEFFNGDIETAFNQALELGFDEQELTGFALQLTKVENTQVIKAYETVSHFDEENEGNEDPTKAVKPVADYMDKLLNVLEGSRLKLENNKSYENMVNELINRLGDVATPDLISAINRFNDFNQKLVDNLPIGFQPQS
ncbi:DUF5610 domain-containing protein [Paraglaciecola aquimarina]|uniref:DUF5610 domain-containing protein n=1 Tax=Paraglaciecola algarum TaxID=3050085 RepID=A0ABS9D5G4_9ALTE|nr:DUF5610 domain-containing protein [Paraglaciecola sp. G1-23]MCF2947257.1 DUF5610 domain-containing protein [Paraglaciecola sp. G1-23]